MIKAISVRFSVGQVLSQGWLGILTSNGSAPYSSNVVSAYGKAGIAAGGFQRSGLGRLVCLTARGRDCE
jgi:hypothetical protein